MSRAIVEIKGTRFVLIPEAELEAIEEASLPPLPPVSENGDCEALPYIRASIARGIIKDRWELGLTQAQLMLEFVQIYRWWFGSNGVIELWDRATNLWLARTQPYMPPANSRFPHDEFENMERELRARAGISERR